jgi:hypothetical protein
MSLNLRVVAATLFLCVAGAATDAFAQNGTGAIPFSNTYRRPSVNPMTMMGTGMGGVGGVAGAGLVYQQLVQPRNMQEQQVISQMQQGRAISTLQGRVAENEKRVTARFDQTIRPTGHASTYMNLSHFYPR